MTEPLDTRPAPGPGPIRPGPVAPPDATGGPLGGGGSFLRQRTAGLPNWAWLGIAVVGGAIVFLYLRKRNQTSTASGTDSNATQPATLDDTGTDESILANLRDLQGAASVGYPQPNPDAPVPEPTPTQPPPTTTVPPAPAPAPVTPAPSQPAPQRVYVVQSGDNLTAIASRLGISEPSLYSMNADTIELAARAHGLHDSRRYTGSGPWGWWIYPGERLVY